MDEHERPELPPPTYVVDDLVFHYDPANPVDPDKYDRVVIYHGNCKDGFCAAWVAHLAFQCGAFAEHSQGNDRVLYVAGVYGQDPPWDALRLKPVLIADFSYPRAVIERMKQVVWNLTILDHHKTAAAALEGIADNNTKVVFDMDRSGAGITWDYLFPGFSRPALVDYVEDRDLWRHALPDSHVINAAIATLPFTFAAWSDAYSTSIQALRVQGKGALAKTSQYVREVAKNAVIADFLGTRAVVVNAPQVDISDLLHACLEMRPEVDMATGWWVRADGVVQVGLRSRQGGLDVSILAQAMGGGGHRSAAGFQVPSLREFFERLL